MDDIFRFADHLGPAKIVHITEPSTGLKAVVVVDNVAAGPSIGGVRMAPNVTTEECFRLARAMTLKNAAAGLPHGGGKSVIVADPKAPTSEKERLIRAFAAAILLEQNDEWAVCRKYMTLETLAQISHPEDQPLQIAAE